ncbi:hypothetical protein Tcan_17846 [Toxocara canis]|uniref:Uncharacterized protein n=1 Tax=Toxocara canis TaxID=6265 RepID=A0A0B2VRL7_TOXCA|nr:hypothetical protein Tcan_17846 [Toxocara canis]
MGDRCAGLLDLVVVYRTSGTFLPLQRRSEITKSGVPELLALHRCSLNAFKGCAEFTSFRDYTLELEPREEFDGMPKGYAGLQGCLELCVLSPNFFCKVSIFILHSQTIKFRKAIKRPSAFLAHFLSYSLKCSIFIRFYLSLG